MFNKTKLLYLCIFSFFISSLTVFFVPLYPRDKYETAANILACIFWFFLIAGIVLTVMLANRTANRNMKGHSLRVFRFFKSKPTIITDTVLFLAAIAFAMMGTFNAQSEILYEFVIFLLLFSAEMHCVFNLVYS